MLSLPKSLLKSPIELDSVVNARIISGCWFAAAWGVAIVQMLLLSQAWRQDQHATRTACIASSWIIGAVIAQRLQTPLRRLSHPTARWWGIGFLAGALLWLMGAPSLRFGPGVLFPGTSLSTLALFGASFLLGMLSAAWLLVRRPWPDVAEWMVLARSAVCLTLGLFVVWVLPAWAAPLCLALLLPLLALDLIPSSHCPFPTRGTVIATLNEKSGEPGRWVPLRLTKRGRGPWWWLSYLARRQFIPPTVLASSAAIILGGIWNSVPTPFAGDLAAAHELGKLGWLVAGQLVALAAAAYCFGRSRRVVGSPDRLIPEQWRTRAWYLAQCMLLLAAASLVLLGLPFLQDPWWLGLSLGCYTLAVVTWGILLPRLRPSADSQMYAYRHLGIGVGGSPSNNGLLAHERAMENDATVTLSTGEGIATALVAIACGFLIDLGTVDHTLVAVGLVLAAFLLALVLCLNRWG